MVTEEVNGSSTLNLEQFLTDYDKWFALPALISALPGRYKHAAQVVDGKVFVTGGSRNGRHLSDIQIFYLRTWKWSTVNPSSVEDKAERRLETLPYLLPQATEWQWFIGAVCNMAGHLKDSCHM